MDSFFDKEYAVFKAFYAIWGSLLLAANAFAVNQGDVLRIVYDLQGGRNNPDNISSYRFDKDDLGRIYLCGLCRYGRWRLMPFRYCSPAKNGPFWL